jgi:predicted metal-dependent peptidase
MLGKLRLAISRLARQMPFHSAVLGRFSISEDESVGTMGVGFRHGRLSLVFNPAFVEGLTLDETAAVLAHEVGHTWDHVFHEPQPGENKTAMVIAQETVVNEWIPASLPLPGDPVTLDKYPDMLRPNQTTEERYLLLKDVVPDTSINTTDSHGTWGEVQNGGVLARAAIIISLAGAWDDLSEAQKASVPWQVREKAQEITEKARASLVEGGTGRIPWQEVLRRYVGRSLHRRPVFGNPPRRFPNLIGILPASGRSSSKPKILAVIDTSASMSRKTLAEISSELARMNKSHFVTVVECDSEIRDVYPYRPITHVKGRGGTSFLPVFEQAFLRQYRPDLICYFTDGGGPAPKTAPRMPVLWCLTPNGRRPCAWGQILQMG